MHWYMFGKKKKTKKEREGEKREGRGKWETLTLTHFIDNDKHVLMSRSALQFILSNSSKRECTTVK